MLIDALYCIEDKAKFSYSKKYLKEKNKGDNLIKIERWQLYQLIKIAEQQEIISYDVSKISEIIRNYRNLIHLWAQKRDKLNVNLDIAKAVIDLLIIAYKDIRRWHLNRKNNI